MTELLHAVLERMASWDGVVEPLREIDLHLLHVFLDELRAAPEEPLRLPMPRERRLLAMAAAVALDPADEGTLESWAERIGLSPRSLTFSLRGAIVSAAGTRPLSAERRMASPEPVPALTKQTERLPHDLPKSDALKVGRLVKYEMHLEDELFDKDKEPSGGGERCMTRGADPGASLSGKSSHR